MKSSIFEWLQAWYRSQYNEDWEDQHCITIETVDNPGWYITINLSGTALETKEFNPIKVEKDSTNWYFCLIREGNFEASCGAANLTETLEIFRDWAENAYNRPATESEGSEM
jgi:hypothetical protein